MKALRIVSKNKFIKQFWCKNCKRSHNELIKIGDDSSFCELCVPEQYKDKLITINQNREVCND